MTVYILQRTNLKSLSFIMIASKLSPNFLSSHFILSMIDCQCFPNQPLGIWKPSNGFLVRWSKFPGDSEQREIKRFESVCGGTVDGPTGLYDWEHVVKAHGAAIISQLLLSSSTSLGSFPHFVAWSLPLPCFEHQSSDSAVCLTLYTSLYNIGSLNF